MPSEARLSPELSPVPDFSVIVSTVAIVATIENEEPAGCTVAVWGERTDPPLLLTALDRSSATHAHVMSTSRFSANVLGVGQESIAWCFGAKSLSATERFAQIPWHVEDGVPVLDEARVVYVCSVESVAAFGSQDIVIGRVRTCTVRDASAAPLLHYNGAMTTIQDSAHQDLAAPD